MAALKTKAQTPLVIDADAPLTLAITSEGFEAVVRRYLQILQADRAMQHRQLSLGHRTQISKAGNGPSLEQISRIRAAEGLDHAANRITSGVKRQ